MTHDRKIISASSQQYQPGNFNVLRLCGLRKGRVANMCNFFQTQLVDLKGYISSKCSKQHSKTKGHAATQSRRAKPKTCTRTAWLQCLFEPKPNGSILARCHISQVDGHASGSNCSTSVNLRCPLLPEHAFLNRAIPV